MSINLDNVKQIIHNNKEVIKIENSHGIVWQKNVQLTITYELGRSNSLNPGPKTVTPTGGVYTLTSADLPTLNESTSGYTIDGWTLDGSNKVTVGTQISTNITLKAIHKIVVSKTYDWNAKGSSEGSNQSASASHTTSGLFNLSTNASANYTCSYSKTNSSYYHYVGIRGFNGNIITFQLYSNKTYRAVWTPAVTSVTYSYTNEMTIDGKYADTYPMFLVRNGDTTTSIAKNANVSSLNTTFTAGSSNAYVTFQYGGWDTSGGNKTSWARQYKNVSYSGSYGVPSSNKSGNQTDTIYIYVQ